MKYYRLKHSEIANAVNNEPLECYFSDEVYGYHQSPSNEVLELPFEALRKNQVPKEFFENIAKELNEKKEKTMAEVKGLVNVTSFVSNVLGENYLYDFAIEDQLNLSQAKEMAEVGLPATIRAKKLSNGVKDNYEHSAEQLGLLFQAYYNFKRKILNAYSVFKIEVGSASDEDALEKAVLKFKSEIGIENE